MGDYPYESARECVEAHLHHGLSPIALSNVWSVHNTHIYRARMGDVTPLLVRRLRELGLVPPHQPRIRLAASVDREQRERLKANAKQLGYQSWTEFCRAWADGKVEVRAACQHAEKTRVFAVSLEADNFVTLEQCMECNEIVYVEGLPFSYTPIVDDLRAREADTYYFIDNRFPTVGHIAVSKDIDDILFKGNYHTYCGTVSPGNVFLSVKEPTALCEFCLRMYARDTAELIGIEEVL